MSRPPPLDAKTERDLREACSIILADLKPSGHDLEDTRMKSDIFVGRDDAVSDPRAHARVAAKQAPAAAAASSSHWNTHKDPLASHRAMPRMEPPAASTRQAQAAMGIDLATANPLSARKPVPVPNHLSLHQLAPEAPLAPIPSTSSSAFPLASPRPPATQRDTSISTAASSSYPLSSDHSKSASTTLSSAPFTPSETSHRLSDNIYSQQASTKDSQWMKEMAEKQRQAYVAEAPLISQSVTRAPAKSQAVDVPERPSSTGSRSRSLHSHPIIDGMANVSSAPRPLSRQSNASQKYSLSQSPAPSSLYGPTQSARPGSIGSKRSSRPASSRLSIDGLKETDRSPVASPSNEDVPPVPRIDASRMSTLQSARPLSQISVATSGRGEPQSVSRAAAAPSGSGQQAWPITASVARQSTQSTYQQRPAYDNGVVVKDFSPMNHSAPKSPVEGFMPLNRDPRPEDFENLMSAMNHRASTMDPAQSPDSPTVPMNTISGLRMTDPSAAAAKASYPHIATVAQPSGHVAAQTDKLAEQPHHSPSLSISRNDRPASPGGPPRRASESRALSMTLSATARKEKKGVRGLLWKLGGGDAPERRRVYVAPAMTGYAGYDDYWADADDQACAAPVVGFGRGW